MTDSRRRSCWRSTSRWLRAVHLSSSPATLHQSRRRIGTATADRRFHRDKPSTQITRNRAAQVAEKAAVTSSRRVGPLLPIRSCICTCAMQSRIGAVAPAMHVSGIWAHSRRTATTRSCGRRRTRCWPVWLRLWCLACCVGRLQTLNREPGGGHGTSVIAVQKQRMQPVMLPAGQSRKQSPPWNRRQLLPQAQPPRALRNLGLSFS